MNKESGLYPLTPEPLDGRRSGADRRAESERRRRAQGLFELRAHREGAHGDRRRGERRDSAVGRWWQSLWRRDS
ncbi:MAG: hypothetical protein R3E82_19515 [Pseudomonadales bacterium]|nr:hypothetical protein [Pseudomonadales bacterium]